jgi:hypothetical protein
MDTPNQVKMYRHIEQMAKALEGIAASLEVLADAAVREHRPEAAEHRMSTPR